MAARAPRSSLVAASISALVLALGLGAFSGTETARAANGTCNFTEGWVCNYYGNSWPKHTKLWFEAAGGNNQRNWFLNYGFDGHGNTVEKCSGFLSYDGGELPHSCAITHASYLSIPAWRRPGWIHVVHHASGPRNISGQGYH